MGGEAFKRRLVHSDELKIILLKQLFNAVKKFHC